MKPLKYIDPLRIFDGEQPLIDLRDPDHRLGVLCAIALVALALIKGCLG